MKNLFQIILEIIGNALADVFEHDTNRLIGFLVAIGCAALYKLIFNF